ncbi:MAG: FAD-binding oxidoreductase [Thermoplasmata archaeon]|jgi:glycolate oxidase|nr:FAD-binding oxidoreductase [Thermoplasmata archaeon]MVT13734.1 FAD-binding protein [Euryarchaeota archaeon]MVT15247.1 FAD-binding protein [Euryarchaeota archaeon]MVT36264.1 FAD-binding protein [Euryarchaeota archaeon]
MDIKEFIEILGKDYVLTEKVDILPYTKDASFFTGKLPYAVLMPGNVNEVSSIMKICQRDGIPVTVRGGGSSLTGSSILVNEGVILSMARFDKILETSIEDRYVIAEAGVKLDYLNSHLLNFKHFYPPDPASSIAATVGGSISTNAGGLRAAMYGATKEWVLGLEVVLPDGTIIQTGGKVLKRSIGYDLTALMVGSEGTLGVITKAILKISPIPEKYGRIMVYYRSIEEAGKAISSLKKNGITPLIAEFMDKISMDSITHTKGLKFPEQAQYLLLIDISSTEESLDKKLNEAAEILKSTEILEIKITKDPDEMAAMYQARKGLYSSQLNEREKPGEYVIIGDIVVPASKLPKTLIEIKESIERYKLKVALFGHIGDGNIHANIFADINDREKMKIVNDFMMELGRIALKNDGSVSSEHGIGIEKIELLREEYMYKNSLKNIEIMKSIKNIFDPKNILNRGKMF